MLELVIIWASIIRSASCATISLVPLHKPAEGLRFRSNIIGVPIFKEILCWGTPLKSSWLINSIGYNKSMLSMSLEVVSIESQLRKLYLSSGIRSRIKLLISETVRFFGVTIASL